MAGRGVDILLGGNPEGLAKRRRRSRKATTSSVMADEFELPLPIDQMPEDFQLATEGRLRPL